MKNLLLLLLCLSFLNSSFGQGNDGLTNLSDIMTDYSKSISGEQKNKNSTTFYLNEEWQGGVIFTKDSSSVKGYTYKYNIYTDQIELRTVVDPTSIDILSIGSKKFIFSEYFNDENLKYDGYFELLINGECKLLVRREVKMSKGTSEIEAYGSGSSVKILEDYYIKKGNEPAQKIIKSKEFFMSILTDKEEMDQFIQKKTSRFISTRNIKDIIKHYNKI